MLRLKLIAHSLHHFADEIDAGNTNASESELLELCDYLGFITDPEGKLSKYQAIKFLGISRATFDNWVKEGKIPEGRKEQGFKEKFWIRNDLDKIKKHDI